MEIYVDGVMISGDVKDVYNVLVMLGIKPAPAREKRYHWSQTKGTHVFIEEMDTNHIRNSLVKILRENGFEVGTEQVDLWYVLERFVGETPEDHLRSLGNEDFILFMKMFMNDHDIGDEFTWLIEEMEYREENGL